MTNAYRASDLKFLNGNSLREYQIEGVDKFAEFPQALFADEMGVGKTIQCIALDQLRRMQAGPAPEGGWKTLVVAPLTGVIDQWVEAFEQFTDLRVRRINNKKREWLFKQDADVYIVHPEGLRIEEMNLIHNLPTGKWLHFIFDEVHIIKNRKARVSKAAVEVGKHFPHRTGATGTPMENRPDELWHIFKWLFPTKASRDAVDMSKWDQKLLNSYWRFFARFVESFEDDDGYTHIIGPRKVEALKELREPFWIRRLKSEVLKDLPPKQYQTIEVDLHPKQRRAYDSMKKRSIAWIGANEDQPVVGPQAIVELTRLQQFGIGYGEVVNVTVKKRDGSIEVKNKVKLTEPSSKIDALQTLVEGMGSTQAVIFSTSKQGIYLAGKRLEDKCGSKVAYITGDVSALEKSRAIKDFQSGEVQFILATIRAGGVGLNLQNCNVVMFLDRDWSPGKNQQAEDRVHRSGQTAPKVHIIDFVARRTVDQRKRNKLVLKWSWIKEVVGA